MTKKLFVPIILLLLTVFTLGACDRSELVNTLEGLAPLIAEFLDNQRLEDVKDDIPPVVVDPPLEDDTNDDTEEPPVIVDKKEKDLKWHHHNPAAWHGVGSAIVLCPGVGAMDKCTIDGVTAVQHGAQDKGRYLYTVYRTPGLGGKVVCERGNTIFRATVNRKKLEFGSCN